MRIPAFWTVVERQLGSMIYQTCLHFLARAALVRPLLQHELVANDADCVEVGFEAVLLPKDDLGRHIARCARTVMLILAFSLLCYAEICQSEVALVIEDEVLRLDIAMDHIL